MPKFENTKVAEEGLTKLIQRLGRDCTSTQFVREFVMNSIEAVQRTGETGDILIDVNWDLFKTDQIHKISFTDNGDGMSLPEMRKHLNNLSSSGDNENVFENYGMGAKIAALTRNHEGIVYDSWRDGTGSRIIIAFDRENHVYGIVPSEQEDGSVNWGIHLTDDDKPALIEEHGTRVTLLGQDSSDDTMLPPKGAKGGRENWLHYYINSRFFEIPDTITIRVRTGYYRNVENKKHNYLRVVRGQKCTLDDNSLSSGVTQLSDAKLHWWILNSDATGHGRENLNGHTGCLNQNELFDITDGRSNRAPSFGIILGKENVVLYIEPASDVVQDTTRTRLVKVDGDELPWERWQDEFRDNFPPELTEFIKEKLAAANDTTHAETIRKRLDKLKEFFRLSRFRTLPKGNVLVDPTSETVAHTGSGQEITNSSGGRRDAAKGEAKGAIAELLKTRQSETGENAKATKPDNYPEVIWVSVKSGSRSHDELRDRAAEYLEQDNVLKINADFQGFIDVHEYYCRKYVDIPHATELIWEETKEIFEQILVEAILGAQQLKDRPEWTPQDYDNAVSQEALTTISMTRYQAVSHLNSALPKKLPKLTDGLPALDVSHVAGIG